MVQNRGFRQTIIRDGPLLASAALVGALVPATAHAAPQACAQLTRASLPSVQIVSAVQVQDILPAADLVPSRGANAQPVNPHLHNLPPFCRVIATLTPVRGSRIGIELWLPENWNGKLLGIGNHGFGGEYERGDMAQGMHRGYAVVTTDMGHSTPGYSSRTSEIQAGFNVGIASFAVGNPVAVEDFAWRATHEMTVTAKALIRHHYGKKPRRSYFNACSGGGRQALREAQQFPKDYDGIIAGSAAMYWTRAMASTLYYYRLGFLPSGARMTAPKLRLAQNAAIAACDRLDGLADGLIADPARCSWNPKSLLCRSGTDKNACLSPEEIAAIEAAEAPFRDPRTGEILYEGQAPGSESYWRNMLSANSVTTNHFRFLVAQDSSWEPGPNSDPVALLRLSERPGAPALGINSVDPDLSAFRAGGGKLIQYHGWNDASFAPAFVPRYYSEVVDLEPGRNKLASTQNYYRLFMVPGMAHCHGGEGPVHFGALDHETSPIVDADHDVLEALDRWVDRGVAPAKIIATQFDRSQRPQRQMPICPWPQVALYSGGDPNRAESFACRTPAQDRGS